MSENFSIPQSRLGVLLVVSGPSGSGKTTLCRKLSDQGEAVYSISCTTRAARQGEVHGKDYFFLTEEDFVERIGRNEFFEHAHVHGKRYGTLKSYVTENLLCGVDVVMDIDVQGAEQVRSCQDALVKQCLVDVFILPPSVEELKARLAHRGTEGQAALDLRLKNAIGEMSRWQEYAYTLVSGSREADMERFRSILVAERMRSIRQPQSP
ncbi:MAG: guanylate kinase [Verrucomicrobiaceae bacterium]|nr:guanylate kinase [Verrucomicrobiaceae bacterium]